VGVAVDINQAGAYGRIELGNRPPPPVIYPSWLLPNPPKSSQPLFI